MQIITAIRKKDRSLLLKLLAAVLMFILSFWLFYHQAIWSEGSTRYWSDLPEHLQGARTGTGYSLVSLLLKFGLWLTGTPAACAVILAAISTATLFACAFFFRETAQVSGNTDGLPDPFMIAVPLCFLGGIFIPVFFPVFYYNSSVGKIASDFTQPWHNSTYLAMRLFALLTMGLYFRIQSHYLTEGISAGEWFLFFLSLSLTNAAKPNFFIAFAPAMLCVLIYDQIRTKWKYIKQGILFGSAVLCSMPVLLFQMNILFPGTEESNSGIILSLLAVKNAWNSGRLVPCLIAGFAFPVGVTACCIRTHRTNRTLAFGWILYGFTAAERWLIQETGERAKHGNFQWGISLAGLILTVICVERLLSIRKQISKPVYYILLSLLVLMVLSGLAYFAYMMMGGDYLR